MKEIPLKRAGSALTWKAAQLGGVKAIFLLRLLILTWLLTPEDFGLLAIAVTAIGFFMTVTDIGMIPALVQGADVDEKQFNVAWSVGLTRALLITAVTILAAPIIAGIFAEPRAVNLIRVLALRPLLDALGSIKVATLTRNLEFRPLAIIKLGEAIMNTVVSIALAYFLGVWALVAGALAGSTLSLILSYLLAPHRPRLSFDRAAIRPLIRFGRWIFLTSLIVLAGSYVLRVVISRQLGTAELGLYFLAAQLAFLPAELASEIVGDVAFPLISRYQSELRQVTKVFHTMLTGLAALLFPVCMLLFVLAPLLVQEILGPRWDGTVPVIRILTLVSLIGIFGEVTGPIFKGLGQPYRVTLLEVVQSLTIISLVWGLTSRFGLAGAALAWLPTVIISQLISAVFIRRALPEPFVGLWRPLLLIILCSGLGAFAALLVVNIIPGLVGFVLASLLAVVMIGVLLWLSDRRFALGLVDDLGQTFPQVAAWIGYSPAKS